MITLPDIQILHGLGARLDDSFSLDTLEAAARALADHDNPLRLNFFCIAMRILFEHSMDRLSPTEQVQNCSWFTPAPEIQNGLPTRAQRVKYAVQGGLADDIVANTLKIDVKPLQRSLADTISELGKHIHAREHTVIRDHADQDALAAEIIGCAEAYFDAATSARAAILDPIKEALDEASVDALLAETILEIDELATHHSIEEVYVDRIIVHRLDASEIVYRARGTISVGLQWGSNSDVRRGDGAELDESFPFECDITLPIEEPWDLDYASTEYRVDTSEWTDAMAPDPGEEEWA